MPMRLLLFLALAVFFPSGVFCQIEFLRPDYDAIEHAINDKADSMYYPSLFHRYVNNDTGLTTEQYRHLYYGYLFQEGYNPYGIQVEGIDDSIRAIMNKSEISQGDWKRIAGYSKESLQKGNPFNLDALYYLLVAYSEIGDTANEELCVSKLGGLLSAIGSTGNGLTEETAFHVINVSDEYTFLKVMGYTFAGKQHLTKNTCDYLEVTKEGESIDGMYFDVKQIFKAYGKEFKK